MSINLLFSGIILNKTFAQATEADGEFLPSSPTKGTYKNPQLGVSVELPSNWQIEDQKNGIKFVREQNIVSIDIRVNEFNPSFTDITQYAIEDLNDRKNSRKDFKLLSSEEAIISENVPAYKAIYTFMKTNTNEGQTDKILRFWILNENKVFTIAYVAAIDKYDVYLPEAQSIIDSLKIGDVPSETAFSPEQRHENMTLTSPISELSTYENESLGIKIDYPREWEKQELGNGIRFVSPTENMSDPFRETFELRIFPMGSLPFLQHGNLSVSDITNGFISHYNNTLPNFEILDLKETLIGGKNEARVLGIKYSDQNTGETQAMNLFTIRGNDILVISYYAQPAAYSTYLPSVIKMTMSLQIVSPVR